MAAACLQGETLGWGVPPEPLGPRGTPRRGQTEGLHGLLLHRQAAGLPSGAGGQARPHPN